MQTRATFASYVSDRLGNAAAANDGQIVSDYMIDTGIVRYDPVVGYTLPENMSEQSFAAAVEQALGGRAFANAHGIEKIRQGLDRFHKLPVSNFTPAMLGAWAADAESNYTAGSGGWFEIRSTDSKTGRPEIVRLDETCFDLR